MPKTINSVLLVTDNFFLNYWVMDGKSQDDSIKILRNFKRKINWVSKKDSGQSDALNQGIKKILANQKKLDVSLFAYINSDDYYLPGVFSTVATAFNEHPEKAWLVGDALIVDEKNQEIQQFVRLYKKFWRLFPLKWIIPILNPIPQPAIFIRLSALKKIGLFREDLQYVMDYDYWLRLFREFGEPIHLSQNLAAFRIHRDSKGGSAFKAQFQEDLLLAGEYYKSPLLLQLHKWHNSIITWIYTWIK